MRHRVLTANAFREARVCRRLGLTLSAPEPGNSYQPLGARTSKVGETLLRIVLVWECVPRLGGWLAVTLVCQ